MTRNSLTKMRSRRASGLLLGSFVGFCFVAPACSSSDGELAPASGGRASASGGGPTAGGRGGAEGMAQGGSSGGGRAGGSAGIVGTAAGSSGEGGSEDIGQGGSGVAGGGTEPPGPVCTFHSDPVVDPSAGGAPGTGSSPGEGGAAGSEEGSAGSGGAAPVYDITVQKSAFVGKYLADAAGKALYFYTADYPGDCETPPVSNCNDVGCVASWPIFNAGERALVPELDDELFGTIQRADGSHQTTYLGWPLYYYKTDLAPGDVKGHAVGRIWHLAELSPPNVVLLRIGTQRLLGDGNGRALYVFAEDSIGTSTSSPISACTGSCRRDFPPFAPSALSPVSYLEPNDFRTFVRSDGDPQVAYKGAPLYRAATDTRSGVTNGTAAAGWTVAAP